MNSLIEVFTLTQTDIVSGYLTTAPLAYQSQLSLPSLRLMIKGMDAVAYGIDYQLADVGSGDIRLSWDTLDLDGLLLSGDQLAVYYQYTPNTLSGQVDYSYASKMKAYTLTDDDLVNQKITFLDYTINNPNRIFEDTILDISTTLFNVNGAPAFVPTKDFRVLSGANCNGDMTVWVDWSISNLSQILKVNDVATITYSVAQSGLIQTSDQFTIVDNDIKIGQVELSKYALHYSPNISTNYAIEAQLANAPTQTINLDYTSISGNITWFFESSNNPYAFKNIIKKGDVVTVYYHTAVDPSSLDIQIYKIHEDWDFAEVSKQYALNPVWQDEYATLWETISGSTNEVARTVYEHIANFVQNIQDVDVCSINALYSMAQNLDQDIFSYNLEYPIDLEYYMNLYSINRSILLTPGYVLHSAALATLTGNILLAQNVHPITESQYSGIFDPTALSGIITAGSLSGQVLNETVITDDKYLDFIYTSLYTLLVDKTRYFTLPVGVDPALSATYVNQPKKALALNKYAETQQYIGFMSDIYSVSGNCWSESTSASICHDCALTLRNICIRTSYHRENLKRTLQKYSMYGTARAVELLLRERICRTFTKKQTTDWRYQFTDGLGAFTTDDVYFEDNLPYLNDISGFNINVVEYFDKTSYLNLNSDSPYKIGVVSSQVVTTDVSWIDVSGNYHTSAITNTIPVYGRAPWFGKEVTGGIDKFWEDPSYSLWIKSSEHTSAEVSAFYANIYQKYKSSLSGNVQGNSTLADYESFLDVVWNTNAVSGWNYNADIYDLTGGITETNLSGLQQSYMGTLTANLPYGNIPNQNFPTIAPQPFIWNLIKKAYGSYPTILETVLWSEPLRLERLRAQVNAMGVLQNSWKYYLQDLAGYQTSYEQSTNLNYAQAEDSDIDRDGPFHPAAMKKFLTRYPSTQTMSGYYEQLDSEFLNDNPSVQHKLRLFKNDTIALSGITIYDRDITFSQLQGKPFHEVLAGQSAFNYSTDIYNNAYTVYKTDNDYTTPGALWLRYHNHPLGFPAASAYFENVTTLTDATNILKQLNLISTNNSSGYYEVDVVSGSYYQWYNFTRTQDVHQVATWYSDVATYSGNVFNNTLRINDYNMQQIYLPYPILNIDWMMNHCYDFICHGSENVIIGKDYHISGDTYANDKIVVFHTDYTNLNTKNDKLFQGCDLTSSDPTSIVLNQLTNIFTVITNERYIPEEYIISGGIENYVGSYVDDNFITFVTYESFTAPHTITFRFKKYDRKLKRFIDDDVKPTYCYESCSSSSSSSVPNMGACCYDNGVCQETTEDDCLNIWAGVWSGSGTVCTPNLCPTQNCGLLYIQDNRMNVCDNLSWNSALVSIQSLDGPPVQFDFFTHACNEPWVKIYTTADNQTLRIGYEKSQTSFGHILEYYVGSLSGQFDYNISTSNKLAFTYDPPNNCLIDSYGGFTDIITTGSAGTEIYFRVRVFPYAGTLIDEYDFFSNAIGIADFNINHFRFTPADCCNVYPPIGTCCDGLGNCSVTTEYDCINIGGDWNYNTRFCLPTTCIG